MSRLRLGLGLGLGLALWCVWITTCTCEKAISRTTTHLPLDTLNPAFTKSNHGSILSLTHPTSSFTLTSTWSSPSPAIYTLTLRVRLSSTSTISPFMLILAGGVSLRHTYTHEQLKNIPYNEWYELHHRVVIPHGIHKVPITIKSGTIHDHMDHHIHTYVGWEWDVIRIERVAEDHSAAIVITSPTHDQVVEGEILTVTYDVMHATHATHVSYTLDHLRDTRLIPITSDRTFTLQDVATGLHTIHIHLHDHTGAVITTSHPIPFTYHGVPTAVSAMTLIDATFSSLSFSWSYPSHAMDISSFHIEVAREYDNRTRESFTHIMTINAKHGKWDLQLPILHYNITLNNLIVATTYHISIRVHRNTMSSSWYTIAHTTRGVIRRNVRDISEQERHEYAHMLLNINNKGAWVKLAQIHVVSANYDLHGNSSMPDEIQIAHKGSAFLPWHRAFLLEMEAHLMVEQPNSQYGLLYWAWHESDRNDTRLYPEIFSASFIGGDGRLDHTTYNNATILTNEPGYRVVDGPMQGCRFDDSKYGSFNPAQAHLSITSPCTITSTGRPAWYALFESKSSPISHDPWGVMRAAGTTVIDHRYLGTSDDIAKIMEMDVFDEGTFSSLEEKQWQICLKNEHIPHKSGCPVPPPEIPDPAIHGIGTSFRPGLEHYHNMIHRYISGSMFTGASANDPLFYLHHANVDMLYDMWVVRHGAPYDIADTHMDWDPQRPRTSLYPYPSGGSDSMWPWMPLEDAELFLRADPGHDNYVEMKDVISAMRQPGCVITPNQVHVPVQQLGYRYASTWKPEWSHPRGRPCDKSLRLINAQGVDKWNGWSFDSNVVIGWGVSHTSGISTGTIHSGRITQYLPHATYVANTRYTLIVNMTTKGIYEIALLGQEDDKSHIMCSSHHHHTHDMATCTLDIHTSHRYLYSKIGVSIISYDTHPIYVYDVRITVGDIDGTSAGISKSARVIDAPTPSIITAGATSVSSPSTSTSTSTSTSITLTPLTVVLISLAVIVLTLFTLVIGYMLGKRSTSVSSQQLATLQTALL